MQTPVAESTFTFKEHVSNKIKSQYGYITYKDWCKREVQRLRQSGSKKSYHEKDGLCWVN